MAVKKGCEDILAQKYELSGVVIFNVVQYACLQALARGDNSLQENDSREGIAWNSIKKEKWLHENISAHASIF